MTLATHIRVIDPIPVEPLFRFCQSLLSNGPQISEHQDRHSNKYVPGYPRNPRWANRLGQGFPAVLYVEYGTDGPLVDSDYDDPHYDEHPEFVPPKACIEIIFDTTYGYLGPNGGTCSDLHAWLIEQVVAHLSDLPMPPRWAWQNEFTGEWHTDLSEPLGNPIIGNPIIGNPQIRGPIGPQPPQST